MHLAGDYQRSPVIVPCQDCYRGLLQGTVTGDCYRGLQGPSHPSVAVGYEEALGQRVGAHGLQKILQWHALAVHPEHHIKFHVIANSGTESTASGASCDMMSGSSLMVFDGYSINRLQCALTFTSLIPATSSLCWHKSILHYGETNTR